MTKRFTSRLGRMWLAIGIACLAACGLASAQRVPQRTLTFRPNDAVEQRYIYRDLGSQVIPEERSRFQDGTSYIVYRFAFVKGTPATVVMRVTAQFKVEASSDGNKFDTLATYTRDKGDPLTLDVTRYTARDGMVYVRVGDAKPDDGWGGKIHEVTVIGRLRDVPVQRVRDVVPIFAKRPSFLYAKLPRPERRLFHFPANGASVQESILFRSLQGLVNRERSQLLIGDTGGVLDELKRRRWVDDVLPIADADELFRRFPRRDAVVYDPALYGSENLAVMIGAMEGWVVAHPDLVSRYHLRVREDLRGKWKATLDGYKEVYARYRGRFNRQTVVMAAPSKRPALYDYAVANRTFTFWIVGGTDADKPGADRWAEEEWFERTLSTDFPVNIPILGYPQVEPADGIGENRGVALFSRCAKFLVPADHMGNMSVLSAYPSARGQLTRPAHPRLALDRSKVYASMVLSDGDNQCLWSGPSAFMFSYMRQMRSAGPREFGVSYTMGPSIVDLNPLAALLTNDTLEPQDSIGGAVSGVGYMYMSSYADNFGQNRERVVRDFINLTSTYMGYANERWDWIMDYGGPGSARLKDYIGLKGCVALMGGYGRETSDPAKTAEAVGPMVAFHSVSRMVDRDGVLKDVDQVLQSGVRPLFLHVFVSNWGINAAAYRALADRLMQQGAVIVTPEVLADLYWQAKREH